MNAGAALRLWNILSKVIIFGHNGIVNGSFPSLTSNTPLFWCYPFRRGTRPTRKALQKKCESMVWWNVGSRISMKTTSFATQWISLGHEKVAPLLGAKRQRQPSCLCVNTRCKTSLKSSSGCTFYLLSRRADHFPVWCKSPYSGLSNSVLQRLEGLSHCSVSNERRKFIYK